MGPGLVSFCALLLILAALGAASLSIFARNENYLAAAYGADSYMVQTYWIAAAKLLVQTALLLASALALFFTSSRIAVFITVFEIGRAHV